MVRRVFEFSEVGLFCSCAIKQLTGDNFRLASIGFALGIAVVYQWCQQDSVSRQSDSRNKNVWD